MPSFWSPVSGLLCLGGPTDVAWLIMAVVVDTVDRHAFRANTQLVQPLLKRLEAKLDVGVGAVVVRLATLLSFVVAVARAEQVWVILDTSALPLAFAAFIGATAAGPDAAFAVELVNSDAGLLAALAGHIHVVPLGHEKEGIAPLSLPSCTIYHLLLFAHQAALILPFAIFLA